MAQDSTVEEAMFDALSNPLRRKIIEFIDDIGGATYTDLIEEFELNAGPLYYHLGQMRQFVYQDEKKKYFLTEDGVKALHIFKGRKDPVYHAYEEPIAPPVFRIGKFTLVPLIKFFANNPIHSLIEFVILAGISVFLGWSSDIMIIGNFIIPSAIPLWLSYLSLIGSWIVIAGLLEVIARFVFKRSQKMFNLINISNLIFLPSFLFILIIAFISWVSGLVIVIPSIVMIILHSLFQIWSFIFLTTVLGELKELSIERSAIISMVVIYIQVLVLILVLL